MSASLYDIEALRGADDDDAVALLTALLAVPQEQHHSGLAEVLASRRAAWRAASVLPRAVAAAGLPVDTPTLIESLQTGTPLPSVFAAELLGTRPAATGAVATLITDDSGEWMAQQGRWYVVAHIAEALGPADGGPLLAALWAVTGGAYRDVHYRIGAALHRWGPDAAPFLRARLSDDPLRALHELATLATRWGSVHPELITDIEPLLDDPRLEAAARRALERLRRGGGVRR